MLVALNCYSTEASAKGAGFSAASPEGKAAKAAEAAAEAASGQVLANDAAVALC